MLVKWTGPLKKYHFVLINKRSGGTSLLTRIGQSFNEQTLKHVRSKLNYEKGSKVFGRSENSNVFQNLINIFDKKNIKEKLNIKDNEKREQEFFDFYLKSLMKYEGVFTYKKFQLFLKDLCDYFNLFSMKYKLKKKVNPQFEKLKKQYEVLNAFLPHELDSDDYKILHQESKKHLAECCNVDIKFIDELLLFHDSLKTDRTWFYRRLIFGRKLPESFEAREIEAPYDRPTIKTFNYDIRESSLEYETAMQKQSAKTKFKTWYSKKHPWFRKNTSGKDRWRIRPFTKKFPYLYYANTPSHLYLSKNPPRVKHYE